MSAIRPRTPHGSEPSHKRRWSTRWLGILAAVAALGLAAPGAASAGGHSHDHAFQQRNLVSDIAGVARITDRNLVNPWGLAAGPTTPLWVADNGTDVSTLYSGAVNGSIPAIVPLVVSIPGGAPTGIVFNPTQRVRDPQRRDERTGCVHLRLRGRHLDGLEPESPAADAGADSREHARRDLQGPGDRQPRASTGRCCTRPTSTAPRSTCSTTRSDR